MLSSVVSDHGFHSFRRGVNLNTWLAHEGYLTLGGARSAQSGPFQGVDWSKTRAYALGLGQIYINLRGRETQGIVTPGAEYTALREEIRSRLLGLQDPSDGKFVMQDVYRGNDIYSGPFMESAPDLVTGFKDGYRVGWFDVLGGLTRAVIENNDRRWSGDHCGVAGPIGSGVLFANRRLLSSEPSILDIAPTILDLLGVAIPSAMDGRPLIQGALRRQ